MRRTIAALVFLLSLAASGLSQTSEMKPAAAEEKKISDNPGDARIITTDIALFWQAYDRATPQNDLIVFRDEYLRRGSYGLKAFTSMRIGSSCSLVEMIEKHPKYYRSIRESTMRIASMEGAIRASLRKMKQLYGGAVFPDVYFLIGRMNSGGTLTDKALLIGAEMYGLTSSAAMEELGDWHKAVLRPVEEVPAIVAHELIHYQQKYPQDSSLLAQAIREGSADFIGELIAGKIINPHLHSYGNERERELWMEFKHEMDGRDLSKWLYQGDKSKDRPADLGYYIGYKIAESYYKQAADKGRAIRDILEIKDFKQFLQSSNYEKKFN